MIASKLLLLAAALPPSKPEPQTVDPGSLSKTVLMVGGLAVVVILYLLIDWIRSRKEARKLEKRREMARESWQEHLKTENEKRGQS